VLIRDELLAHVPFLEPSDFWRHAHRQVFAMMRRLADRGEVIDLITLPAALAQAGELDAIGGPAYLAALVDGVPRSTNIAEYGRHVKTASRARGFITTARAAIDTFSRNPAAIGNGLGSRYVSDISEVVNAAQEEAELDAGGLSQAASDFLCEAPEPTLPLIEGLIPGAGISLPHGQPRSRKSLIVLAVHLAVTRGVAPFGLPRLHVAEPINSIYLTDEDHASEVKKRLRAQLAGVGLTEPPAGFRLVVQKGLSLDDIATQDRLIREIQKYNIRLVTFDPIRGTSTAVDQGPRELQPLVRCLRRIMRETAVVPQLAHHDVKPARDGRADDRPRAQRASGGGILSIAEAPLHVERVSDDVTLLVPNLWKFSADPPAIKIRFENTPGVMRLIAEDVNASAAESLAVHERILTILAERSGIAGNAIAKQARMRREAVYTALEAK
jgi:hypothetical protein